MGEMVFIIKMEMILIYIDIYIEGRKREGVCVCVCVGGYVESSDVIGRLVTS